ncbi:MAG: VOC family protein [Phaeodactylibacter xiamenensis]|uniref:Extradiol dioxygenase n=1 Tax=Phaeodactylibacter xiamenensis TaxID=1524460 RepID=A0A098SFH2_9BACT|nr:VOC family protein [Phaeodactylibacter xiamenensis]KGE89702.1 extradiol dioxygenase [Phaeodactylibacter xiamenensis]MCR9054462.1 VOC family protein [bacterium]
MKQHLARIALLVRDYDEAIEFFVQKMGFTLLEDTPRSPTKRWVAVAPPGQPECSLLLAKAKDEEQVQYIGKQGGGRVFLFLHTDDIQRDYEQYRAAGVHFEETPRQEAFGTGAIFQDLYGNRWELIERKI